MFSLIAVAVLPEDQIVHEIDDLRPAFLGRLDEVDGLAVAQEAAGEQQVVEVGGSGAQTLVIHCSAAAGGNELF